jgi:hypothetical protein
MDGVYVQFRDIAAENFPKEEHKRARSFGTFLGDLYTPEFVKRIESIGGKSLWELLAYKNDYTGHFEIDPAKRAKPFP